MKLKKIGVMALITILTTTPALNSVYALGVSTSNVAIQSERDLITAYDFTENELINAIEKRETFNMDTPHYEMFSDDQIRLSKFEFQKLHGTEDTFKFFKNVDGVDIEVNGYRGIIKLTSQEDGEIIINQFEALDNLANESKTQRAPSRPGAWRTQGYDKANLSVTKGSPNDTLRASNPVTGNVKKYTKTTSNWYSGYTKGYYNNVQEARRCIGTAKSNASNIVITGLAASLTSYVAASKFNIGEATLKAHLIAGGLAAGAISAITLTYAVLYLGHVGIIMNNYRNL